jgi:hypothetical protein
MARHTHTLTIANDNAVRALIDKLVDEGPRGVRREKPCLPSTKLHATTKTPTNKFPRAFFHGLLTDYAVALKLS